MKHHQHTVYGGKIETLRKELTTKIEWAIRESQKIQSISQKPPYEISSGGIYFPSGFSSEVAPVAHTIPADDGLNELSIIVRNSSGEMSGDARYVYLFTDNSSVFDVEVRGQRGLTYSPKFQIADPSDSPDGLSRQYRLPNEIPALPPGASEILRMYFSVSPKGVLRKGEESLRLRIHTGNLVCDYRFKLAFQEKTHSG